MSIMILMEKSKIKISFEGPYIQMVLKISLWIFLKSRLHEMVYR